jgi:hypothetical protein
LLRSLSMMRFESLPVNTGVASAGTTRPPPAWKQNERRSERDEGYSAGGSLAGAWLAGVAAASLAGVWLVGVWLVGVAVTSPVAA